MCTLGRCSGAGALGVVWGQGWGDTVANKILSRPRKSLRKDRRERKQRCYQMSINPGREDHQAPTKGAAETEGNCRQAALWGDLPSGVR